MKKLSLEKLKIQAGFASGLKKFLRLLKKIIKKENILVVKQNKDKWERQFSGDKWDFLINDLSNQPHVSVIYSVCLNLLNKKGQISIFDVGCGNGALAYLLRGNKKIAYYGLDISQNALDKIKDFHSDAKLFCADAKIPPAFNREFDVLVFSEVLLYFDFENILNKYQKFLKKDGKIIISLYSTWRTKLIWHKINKMFIFNKDVIIKNKITNISWRLKSGEYKN